MTKLDLTSDIINMEDITERFEELEAELMPDGEYGESGEDLRSTFNRDPALKDEWAEYDLLLSIINELVGMGGDEKWRGNWYPQFLLAEHHFTDYIEGLIKDCYEMPKEMDSGRWPYRHMTIDYEEAAHEAKMDYSEITILSTTYLYR
jgi:hypothetical protein